MKQKQLVAAAATLVFSLFSVAAVAAMPERESLAPMLENVTNGVVNVSTKGEAPVENPLLQDPFFRRFFGGPNEQRQPPQMQETQNLGSGVVIDAKKGYILTNQHVIDQADEISVTLRNGTRLDAKLVGADPDADVALLKVDPKNLTAIPIGDSDKLRVGDFVVAIGNPFGLGQTVTSGIVSALGRSGLGIEGYEDFIQTDASINPGNSGGALVTTDGKLIGINTAILAPSGGNIGIGFAIPINMAQSIADQLIKHGEVRRGRLGIYIQDLTPQLARALGTDRQEGVVISQVIPDSPADKAGLKQGDIVVKFNGQPVQGAQDLRNAVGLRSIGEKIQLTVVRDGKTREVTATIAAPTETKVQLGKNVEKLRGVTLGELDTSSPLYGKVKGLVVKDIQRGTPAWNAGLRQNDVIVAVNRHPVQSLPELRQVLGEMGKDQPVLFNVRRGEGALFLVIE